MQGMGVMEAMGAMDVRRSPQALTISALPAVALPPAPPASVERVWSVWGVWGVGCVGCLEVRGESNHDPPPNPKTAMPPNE